MDFFSKRRLGISVVVLFGLSAVAMAVDAFPPLVNWAAPATYTPSRSEGARALGDITNPAPFIGVTPCRQFDIRPGTLADNTPMAITLTGGACGIPTSAVAVSLNITIFSIVAGANGVFKVGTVNPPTTAWINYPPTESQRGNAGALPVNGSGQIWVEVNQGGGSIQLTVDVNGYYAWGNINAGEAFALTGNIAGFPILLGINLNGGGFPTAGIAGQMNGGGADAAGVIGWAVATSGSAAGVLGRTSSATGLGVKGINDAGGTHSLGIQGVNGAVADPLAGWTNASGLQGLGSNGVLGHTSTAFGFGVTGVAENTAGTVISQGLLGWQTHGLWAFIGDIGCTSCTKPFVDPHPTDPTKEIRFVALEGNEAGTYFRGTAETIGREFVIQVPEDFRLVTDSDPDGLTVQLTPVGEPATMYVVSEDLNQIVVHSSKDVKFHYLVQGIRAAFKDLKTIEPMSVFLPQSPDGRMPEGWAGLTKQRLIANGTYNKDGTINMETAERVGWAQTWREAAAAKAKADPVAPKGFSR